MRHVRRRVVRRVTRLAAVGGLVLGGAMVAQAAMASQTPPAPARTLGSAAGAGDTGAALAARLGTARTAGSWIGADGRPV
ncbi:S1 family peptidase, partial [Streptomyces sp. SID161]|nr:S1 family peptidase [Streptomyces sp. SID161]